MLGQSSRRPTAQKSAEDTGHSRAQGQPPRALTWCCPTTSHVPPRAERTQAQMSRDVSSCPTNLTVHPVFLPSVCLTCLPSPSHRKNECRPNSQPGQGSASALWGLLDGAGSFPELCVEGVSPLDTKGALDASTAITHKTFANARFSQSTSLSLVYLP